jgi:hypothetical protein
MDKNKLQKLIKTTLQEHNLKTKPCSCGCNICEDKRSLAPILNESIVPRGILSEGLKYHIDNNKPLTEHIYRAGSENYFNLWAEARALYSRGILEIQNEDDLEILTETNLGEFGILEDGTRVPLDFPMEEEQDESKSFKKGDTVYDKHTKVKLKVTRIVKDRIYTVPFNFPGRAEEWYKAEDLQTKSFFTESKNENKPIGKPMRNSSGGKAYKVYIRDPKTKKIKTLRFGSGGLKAKINNPKARQAFAKRHDCKNKKDRTKPSYWSCRLPRYSKLLGLKSNFSGFW